MHQLPIRKARNQPPDKGFLIPHIYYQKSPHLSMSYNRRKASLAEYTISGIRLIHQYHKSHHRYPTI